MARILLALGLLSALSALVACDPFNNGGCGTTTTTSGTCTFTQVATAGEDGGTTLFTYAGPSGATGHGQLEMASTAAGGGLTDATAACDASAGISVGTALPCSHDTSTGGSCAPLNRFHFSTLTDSGSCTSWLGQ